MHECDITPPRRSANDDHWEVFAAAMDLTIEGHRLITREIVDEATALWRAAVAWTRETVGGFAAKRRASRPL